MPVPPNLSWRKLVTSTQDLAGSHLRSSLVDREGIMQDQSKTQIIIRHVGGANINKIEQFALDTVKEISFGRDTRSTIVFDSPHDDVVSRKHAVLRAKSEEPLTFAIEDLNSSNGTFVNGKRITGEVEIAPD